MNKNCHICLTKIWICIKQILFIGEIISKILCNARQQRANCIYRILFIVAHVHVADTFLSFFRVHVLSPRDNVFFYYSSAFEFFFVDILIIKALNFVACVSYYLFSYKYKMTMF